MTNLKKLNKITNKKQLIKSMVIYGHRHEDFVGALEEDITKLGEKNGREYYLFNDYWNFGVFTCNKNFKNIRFLKKVKEITEKEEKIIKEKNGLYVYGSSHYRSDGKVTSQYVTVIRNTIVIYWKDEEGKIYDIEAV